MPLFHLFILLLVPLSVLSLALERTQCTLSAAGYSLSGHSTSSGVCRYTVKYGQSSRWAYSSFVSTWPNYDTTALPPSCPQPSNYATGSSQSEDCLYAVVYVPSTASIRTSLPVFVWLHGGSYDEGSASAPGLDGSALASEGNMIVITLQYRLGVLGNLPPTSAPSASDPNLALRDVILGLKGVQEVISYIGGDKTKVTLGGQSSGAGLIRALWGAPDAKGLFRGMIMQSDPVSYGMAPTSITAELQQAYYSSSQFSNCTTFSCLQSASLSNILAAQNTLTANAFYEFTGVPLAEPIRPTFNTSTLPYEPTASLFNSPSSLAISPASVPLLVTTVKNEAGTTVQSSFSQPVVVSNTTWYGILYELFGASRAASIYGSPYYVLPASGDGDQFREVFERTATDAAWRCVNRPMANKWAAAGGKVWVGEWRQGVNYVDNQVAGGYCSVAGRVCHEDDIYPTFGTVPSPVGNTTTFEKTIASYWVSFITTLNPNPSSTSSLCPKSTSSSSSSWKEYTATSTDIDVFPLGGDGEITECPAGFWGNVVPYDWQMFG